jgi:hypothetical protein
MLSLIFYTLLKRKGNFSFLGELLFGEGHVSSRLDNLSKKKEIL